MVEFDTVMGTLPSDTDRVAMVALPYRIGLFISHADVTGGWEAQDAEMQTLTTILRSFAEDFCKSAFVQGLLMQTLAGRPNWIQWSHGLDNVPGECVAAMYDLRGVLSTKDLKSFQEQMMDIAFSVAQAFRENKSAPPAPPPSFIARLLGQTQRIERNTHRNISRAEHEAIKKIADALDYDI